MVERKLATLEYENSTLSKKQLFITYLGFWNIMSSNIADLCYTAPQPPDIINNIAKRGSL